MRIELLYWEGCPSYPEARELLEQVLRERKIHEPVEMREVKTQAEAEEVGFPGSPTILVDGRDVDPAGARGVPSLTCRIYHEPDGKVAPLPSRRQLEEAIG
ncbi:MAG: hypothetical protein WBB74_13045 [Gaiellaceae bacterium]